jgi:hypothetical protein
MGTGDQELVVIPLRRLIASAYDLGKELAEKIREEEADRIGPPHAETPPEDIGDIAELRGRLLHPLTGPLIDGIRVVEDARHGRDGDAGT